jgi:hypothetical protein
MSEAETLNRTGNQFYLASDLANAERCYIAAVEADASHADAWGNLGLIWHTIGSLDDALKCYLRSYELKPDSHTNVTNLGMLHEELGHLEHAEHFYRHALTLKPGFPRAQGNLAQMLLSRFEFPAGWGLMQCRFDTVPAISVMRTYPFPHWNGLPTKRLLIWPEQGLGDQVLYSTLLPTLVAMGQPFSVEVDKRLAPAMRRAFPAAEIVVKGSEPLMDCTAHVPMMSLGWFLRRHVNDFTGQRARILTAEPVRVEATKRMLGPCDGERRVAISWRSFHPDINKRQSDRKSAPLAAFKALGFRHDLQLIGAQYGKVGPEMAECPSLAIRWLNVDLFNDIEGVLALIEACDVVVTTSNVTAHFAGGLGKRTYLLARRRPVFFWWMPGEDGRSLWYPSVEIVVGETWEEAVAKVSAEI